MVDDLSLGAGDARGLQSIPHLHGKLRKFAHVLERNGERRRGADEKKPVSTPGDIAGDMAHPRNFDDETGLISVGRDIDNGDRAVRVQVCAHGSRRGVDAVLARRDAAQVGEGVNEADGSVAAHAEVAYVVEEDDPGDAVRMLRGAQQGADEDVRAAGLGDNAAAEVRELRAKLVETLGHCGSGQFRTAGEHEASRLACGMRVEDGDALQGRWCGRFGCWIESRVDLGGKRHIFGVVSPSG